jgi:hypothetical protein
MYRSSTPHLEDAEGSRWPDSQLEMSLAKGEMEVTAMNLSSARSPAELRQRIG